MKQYMSEGQAIYMDKNYGLFSKKLAEWAISNMEWLDPATKTMKPLKAVPIDEMKEILEKYGVELQQEFVYTGWYLYNMALADYPKSLKTDEQRAMFVEETICDPDGTPENVLSCFEAKMCNAGVPIYWETML